MTGWDVFWTCLNLGWLVGFIVAEFLAVLWDGKTLSQYVYDISQGWSLFQFVLGFIVGGLAVHFFWHWIPEGMVRAMRKLP